MSIHKSMLKSLDQIPHLDNSQLVILIQILIIQKMLIL